VLINQGPAAATGVLMFVHNPSDSTVPYRFLQRRDDMPVSRHRMAPQETLVVVADRNVASQSWLEAGVVYSWHDSRAGTSAT
jgi:hypothetical protein